MNDALTPPLAEAARESGGTFWMPPAASSTAGDTDALFYFILVVSALFFVAVVAAMVYFAIRYRRRDPAQKTAPIEGNLTLEVAWSVIPGLILLVIFGWGFVTWMNLNVPPGDATEIRVTGQMWRWSFDYPRQGINADELVVPVGQPVKLVMSSVDVLHSFYVPAFRIKRDLVPNRYTVVWFEPTVEGAYPIFCAEYCGDGHSRMLSQVRVVSQREYQDWLDSGGGLGEGLSGVALGELLFQRKGCTACHTTTGAAGIGPTMLRLYGKNESLTDGTTVLVDDNYLRESIMSPAAKVVAGFQPVMPTFRGQLTDPQVNALIDYIRSLGAEPTP